MMGRRRSETVDVDALIEKARLFRHGEDWFEENGKVVEAPEFIHRLADALVQLRDDREEALTVMEQIRGTFAETPDLTSPDAFWPLGMDDPRYQEGALWVERWWRSKIGGALNAAPSADLDAVKAEAWDEGYDAGQINEHEHRPDRRETNPYRKGTDRA